MSANGAVLSERSGVHMGQDTTTAAFRLGAYASLAAALIVSVACDPSSRLIGDPEAPDTDGSDETDVDETCEALDLAASTVVVDGTCGVTSDVVYEPMIRATNESIGDAYATPIVGFLDGDDSPEIAVATLAGRVVVLSIELVQLWSTDGLGSEPATPAIGDVDGDGDNDLVVAGGQGAAAYDGPSGTRLWAVATLPGADRMPICGGVGLYDFDGDGAMEIVLGRTVLDGKDGSLVGAGSKGEGTGHQWAATFGAAADIDADGTLDVVVGNAVYHADGSSVWENGLSDGFVGVADFDGDAGLEIVVSTFGDENTGSAGTLRLQDDDGKLLWSVASATRTVGPPAVADFDGDGAPEIVVVGTNAIQRFDGDGKLAWQREVMDFSSGFTGVSAFDFDGDGTFEVVYADENDLWAFDGPTGAVLLQETRHSSATCSEYPSVVDLDGDGHAEILYTSSNYSGDETGIRVLADPSWGPAPRTWTQHTLASPAGWRAAAPRDPADATALLGDHCCLGATASIVVRVGNVGSETLPEGIQVSLYAGDPPADARIASARTPAAIAPGATGTGLRFDVARDFVEGTIRVVVDDDGSVSECNEDDNVFVVTDLCGGN